jgi:DNA-directed RNA polymerase II subunit RPB7
LHPRFFGPQISQFVINRLYEEVEGSCSGRYGAIVSVIEIIEVSKGVLQPNTGYAEYKVKYKAILYKPFKNQVVDAIVKNVNKVLSKS